MDEAAQLAEQPLEVLPVVRAPTTKVEGMSTSYRWYAEVTNEVEYLKFLAENSRWHHLNRTLEHDPAFPGEPTRKKKTFPMAELNKLATAQQDNFNIPGVEAKKKPIVSVRS